MARVIVEVLDPNGLVVSRTRLESFPATIGRGYTNEIILDDPYVCPRHLTVSEDGAGGFIAEDAESVNGTTPGGTAAVARVGRVALPSGTEVRIGRTTLRFLAPEHPVKPTLIDDSRLDQGRDVLVRLKQPRVAALLAILAPVVFAASSYFESYDRVTSAHLLSMALGAVTILTVWAGLWALVGRVATHRADFRGHYVVACAALVAAFSTASIESWLGFAFPDSWIVGFVSGGLAMLIGIGLLGGHLALASTMGHRRRWITATAIVGAAAAMSMFSALSSKDTFSTGMSYSTSLKPVGRNLIHAVTIDQFIDRTTELQKEVDKLVEK